MALGRWLRCPALLQRHVCRWTRDRGPQTTGQGPDCVRQRRPWHGNRVTGPGAAIVVGASSEIGRAIAVMLAASGHAMFLWGRDEVALAETARACRALGATASEHIVDVADRQQMRAATEMATAPGSRVRVAVWAAGVFDWGPIDAADPETIDRVLDVGLVAAAGFTRYVLPALLRDAPATLVFIGSGAGHQAYPDNAAYVAAKHGLTGLARATFLDVRQRGVKVSLISPGLVAAGEGLHSPAGRSRPHTLLQPEDVAGAVRYVLDFPQRGCPVEIRLQPQDDPQA